MRLRILLLLIPFLTISCQESKSIAIFGGISGAVIDGQSGLVVPGATVYPLDRPLQAATTDGTGAYVIEPITAQVHTFRASAVGYNTQDFEANVPKEARAANVNFILLPSLYAANKVVIVLTWAGAPLDLDSHLWVPNGGPFVEISYANPGDPALTIDPYAALDVDDTDGFGPETTTIDLVSGAPHFAGNYRFFVHNFSAEAALTDAAAQVRVYVGGTLMKTYDIPTTGTGDYWHVFDLTGTTFTDVNSIVATAPLSP